MPWPLGFYALVPCQLGNSVTRCLHANGTSDPCLGSCSLRCTTRHRRAVLLTRLQQRTRAASAGSAVSIASLCRHSGARAPTHSLNLAGQAAPMHGDGWLANSVGGRAVDQQCRSGEVKCSSHPVQLPLVSVATTFQRTEVAECMPIQW
jgi:hypothetical protein